MTARTQSRIWMIGLAWVGLACHAYTQPSYAHGEGVAHLAAPPGPTQPTKAAFVVDIFKGDESPASIAGSFHFATIEESHPTRQVVIDILAFRSFYVIGSVAKFTGVARMAITENGFTRNAYGMLQVKLMDRRPAKPPPGSLPDWVSVRFNGAHYADVFSHSGPVSAGDISIGTL